jgi:hypothetical protein
MQALEPSVATFKRIIKGGDAIEAIKPITIPALVPL